MSTDYPFCFYVLLCHYPSGPSRPVGIYETWELAESAAKKEWSWERKNHGEPKDLQGELPMGHNQSRNSGVPYYSIDSFDLNDGP